MASKTITNVYKQSKRNRTSVKVEGKSESTKVQEASSPSIRTDDEILRDFDLALEYGPCIGISRLERWQRADKHGLSPPTEVKDMVIKHPDNVAYTHSLWDDYNI
ncbi:DNA polymerase delta subunit 4-like [Littorina saxatilis]|uniref:DNA polymerase delta subunit 4 n=1 Tax=Littorina saxatilis TaxID=31220 RepID=A0AAN9AKZ6_9CAEN